MMSPEEQYPSTHDCARSFAPGDDLVLLCLQGARARVEEGHSRSTYIEGHEVCAIGAVFAQDGLKDANMPPDSGYALMMAIESQLSDEAKEAIEFLNAAALELHPDAEDEDTIGSWSGPLEWVNQEWSPRWPEMDAHEYQEHYQDIMERVKEEVLRIYDKAAANRRMALV